MPNHERGCRPFLLRQCEKLRCEIANDVAIECHKVRCPEGVEDREQQQRLFGRLSQGFSLFDHQTACSAAALVSAAA
jgi:hypothetical protein